MHRDSNRRTKADFRFADARLCFSFAGTLGDRGRPQTYERLKTVDDLTRWCVESGCAKERPACSPRDLEQAKELREAIQRAGKAMAAKERPSKKDIEIINRAGSRPPVVPELLSDGVSVRWIATGLDAVLSTVARDLISVIDSPLRERVRICANTACGVPFVDTSRSGARRWCSMTTCGALAKKRAYRARRRALSRGARARRESHVAVD
jgi:predicted RNA-binding Zn ribbon-like protein